MGYKKTNPTFSVHGSLFSDIFRNAVFLTLVVGLYPSMSFAQPTDALGESWIGYTQGRNDLPEGQFVNWVTNRACMVRADGTSREVLAAELSQKPDSWTQFANWAPDGKQAILLGLWEDRENAAWERRNKTFRMTEGWLVDTYLYRLEDKSLTNLTAIERVSIYNTGLFFLPNKQGFGFTPLIQGISKPFVMDLDGKNKRDVSGDGKGFAYGYSASPDGQLICYHENYQIYVSNADGSAKKHIATGNRFNFVPQWSPDGKLLMFVSGEHYNCHPYVVHRDGTGIRKLADRGGYRGVVQRLKYPDFHSDSSDVPIWALDSQAIFYTAKKDESVELMRTTLDGTTHQITHSPPGTRNYHPAIAPNSKWILFGSDRSGVMQLHIADIDGQNLRQITNVPSNECAMHGHWQPK
ncbi:MAG: hypothetical protein ABL921_14170 [Pirellula sp.]